MGIDGLGAALGFCSLRCRVAFYRAAERFCVVISQLIVAYLIELMGLFGVDKEPFEWRKVLGMLIAIAGIVIFKWQK